MSAGDDGASVLVQHAEIADERFQSLGVSGDRSRLAYVPGTMNRSWTSHSRFTRPARRGPRGRNPMKNTVRTRAAAALAVAGMAAGIGVVASPAAQAVDDDIQTCRVKTSSGTVMASYKVTRYNGKLRDKVVIKPIYYKTNSNYTFRGLSALMMQHSWAGGNRWGLLHHARCVGHDHDGVRARHERPWGRGAHPTRPQEARVVRRRGQDLQGLLLLTDVQQRRHLTGCRRFVVPERACLRASSVDG